MYINRFLLVDSNIIERGFMKNCKTCGKFMPHTRIHLGYKECVRCSDVEKYSAHIVYPHKTGGYVQPVSSDTKDSLRRMDRRSVGGGKVAKGSGSWDRWLKDYYANKEKQKSRVSYSGNTSAFQADAVGSIPSTRSIKDVMKTAIKMFIKDGYHMSVQYVNGLYSKDEITLITKSNINNHLTYVHSHNKKQQRMLLSEVL